MCAPKETHPSREQLYAFVTGRLSHAKLTSVETHVAECEDCCEVLRSFPPETLVHRLRPADTSLSVEDTLGGVNSESSPQSDGSSKLPPELANHPRYRVVRQLGAGGMGVVYVAEHRLMERSVALKVINRRLINNQHAIDRFQQEVKAAAKLSHRNIVTAFDAEQAGDLHFLVMEFVEGESLAQIVARRGQLATLQACNYVMQAAQGLQHASENGMVHRDIKPQNLMRTPKGTIKILDFGLARLASEIDAARLTKAEMALGTADYMAPEQVKDSRHVDIRADIYSLGCTLYYLLAGHVPFPDGAVVNKVLAHLERSPRALTEVRDDLPSDVIAIVERMMAKDPADRFQTPAEVYEALKPHGRPRSNDEPPPDETAEATPATKRVPPEPPAAPPLALPVDPPQPDLWDVSISELESLPPVGRDIPPASRRPSMISVSQWRSYGLALLAMGLLIVGAWQILPVIGRALRIPFNDVAVGTSRDEGGATGQTVDVRLPRANMPPLAGGNSDMAWRGGVWIDLLPSVDPATHAVAGRWSRRGGELVVEAEPNARLFLAGQLPEEYDLEVSFTRNSGEHSIALLFVAGSGQATFELDAWSEHLAGIQNISGQTLQQLASERGTLQLQNGRRYTALVEVRRGQVVASLDGTPIAIYKGDGSDLSVLDIWQLPNSRAIGVGAYDSGATFHRIRVRAGSR